jgi:aspartyl-tRNA(Asn)/glutamyl-tRNA(Gln) amidotransferase subunit B
MRSAEEAKDFLEALRMLLSTLNICNCQMQEGTIRCDVNVSVRPKGQKEYGTRVEMKNVNTFSGAMQAIEYETERQKQMLMNGDVIEQETRRWDEHKCVSVPMRSKENAADYRYFPEADLTPVVVNDEWIDRIRNSLPELPISKFERYRSMDIPETECWMLVENHDKSAFFEECIKIGGVSLKTAVNWIFGHMTARLNKAFLSIENAPITATDLCLVLNMIESGTISNDAGKLVVDELFANGGTPIEIVKRLSLEQVNDEYELRTLVNNVLEANQKSIQDYKSGKSNAFGYLVGQCMKASKGKGNPQIVNKLLREILD